MNLWYSLQSALTNLRVNKLRSTLTMLGIVIGVSALILMVGLLQGAAARITNEFNKLGSNLIIVSYKPDRHAKSGGARRIDGLRTEDVRAIRDHCDLLRDVSPEAHIGEDVVASHDGIETEVASIGVTHAYQSMRNARVEQGRFISQADSERWAKVCVIGSDVRDALFANEPPLGRTIEMDGLSLTVIGVLARKGRSFEGEVDKYLLLPLSTAQKRLLGSDRVDVVYAAPIDPARMEEAKDQVWALLMHRYDNQPGFRIDGLDSVINSIQRVTALLSIILGSVAGLAMLVSGIGIMNIMLVSVTERTREIGVRKAVGARRRDILVLFLIESATVSGVGGLAGIGIGTAAAYAIAYVTTYVPALADPDSGQRGLAVYVPPTFSLAAFLFAAGVGIFFGIYPALRASRLDPIEALRYE